MTFNTVSLENLCEIVSSKRIFAASYLQAGIPFYRGKEISQLARLENASTELFISEEDYLQAISATGPVSAGDILLTAVGTLGNAYQVNESDLPFYFKDGNVVWFRNFSTRLHSGFLLHWLRSEIGQKRLLDTAIGSTQAALTISALRKIQIELPSLKVQASISRLLTAIDLKISTNKNISQTIENIAQCVFQSWFIDFDYVTDELVEGDRVLELNPRTLVESEVGLIPSGWEVKSLSHLLTLHKKTVKPSELTSAAPYVPIDQISPRTVFLHNCLPGELAQTSLVTFEKMDILFGAMRPYFHKVALAPFSGTTRTTTFVLKPKISDSLCFALFTVFQNRAIEYATSHSQGTTIPYAAWSNSFENYRYVQPPLSLVAKFNDLVLPLLEYGHSLLRENQSLLAIRDLLLPRLISGELQIPDEMLES